MGFIEIHSHLLPSVDDGVNSRELALSVVRSYADAGFERVVVTPHLYNPKVATHVNNIREMYNWLSAEALDMGLELELGSETFIGSSLSAKNIPFSHGFVLVEVDTLVEPLFLISYVRSVMEKNQYVVLAHIERYTWFHRNSIVVKKLKEMGVFFQSNCDAVLQGTVNQYLEMDYVDIIAGDNHGDPELPYRLRDALQKHPRVLQNMNRLFNLS